MKKNLLKTLAVLTVVGTVLTGCGGGNDQTDSSDSKKNGEDLTITWWGGDVRNQYTQELLDEYSKENDVKFTATPTSWDGYFEKLATQAAGGSLPTIVQMDYLYISTYAKNKSVADLTPFIEDGTIDVSSLDKSVLDSGKMSGILAGIPLSTSTLTIPYNKNVLDEAGVEYPDADWTWDDFVKISEEVKEKTGKYGLCTNYTDVNMLNYWMRQHNEKLFNDKGTKLAYEDDQLFVDFVEMHKKLNMPSPDEWVTISANGEEARPIAKDEAAFTYGSSTIGVMLEPVTTAVMLNSPPISDENDKALWLKPGMFFSISSSASKEQQKEAAKFINWFINSEEAADKMGTERGIPISSKIRDYLQTTDISEKTKEMFDQYEIAKEKSGEVPPPDPEGISEINKVFADAMDQVMYGKISSKDAAKDFRAKANEILARNS